MVRSVAFYVSQKGKKSERTKHAQDRAHSYRTCRPCDEQRKVDLLPSNVFGHTNGNTILRNEFAKVKRRDLFAACFVYPPPATPPPS